MTPDRPVLVAPSVAVAVEDPLEPLLTAEAVSAILGVRPKRVYELGIPCVHLSARSLRYRRSDVVSWIEGRGTET